MAFTQSDVDKLDAAIASGELSITDSQGRAVTYRSVAELIKARNLAKAEMAASTPTTTRRGAYRVNFSTARGD